MNVIDETLFMVKDEVEDFKDKDNVPVPEELQPAVKKLLGKNEKVRLADLPDSQEKRQLRMFAREQRKILKSKMKSKKRF